MKILLDLFLRIVYKAIQLMNGSLAQLEEHLVYTERVGSSNLSTPTNKEPPLLGRFFVGLGLTVRTPEEGSLLLQILGTRECADGLPKNQKRRI